MKRYSSWFAVLPSLVIPVCLGLSLYIGLQTLIDREVISDEMTLRYLTGHPVSKVTVGMFLIGAASLLVIAKNVFDQFGSEKLISLQAKNSAQTTESDSESSSVSSSVSSDPVDPAELAIEFGQDMLELPRRVHHHYLWDRLVNALHYVYRTGSVAGVEDEMKYLADIDLDRQQQRYSLVRILIWATPMLGFLGTVLGISQALGGIAVGPENDFQQMMDGLRGSLYVAFDTTALALTLSMVLMFCQFLIDRFESQLLTLVDQRSRSEIARQFDLTATGILGGSPTDSFLTALRDSANEQTEIWRKSIRAAEQAWTASLTQTSDVVRSGLTESLDENVASLAHYLGEAIEKADLSMSHRWEQWQVTLSDNARLMERYQQEFAVQSAQVKSILDQAEESSTFKTAMQHHDKAMEATTRTHDVLAELAKSISKVQSVKDLASQTQDKKSIVDRFCQSLTTSSSNSDVAFLPPPTSEFVELNHNSVSKLAELDRVELEELVSGEPVFEQIPEVDPASADAAAELPEIVAANPSPKPAPEISEKTEPQKPPAPDVVFHDRFKKKNNKAA